jgi:transposase
VDTRTFVFKESTMAKTRLPYTPEFRRQMVELVRAGRSPEELAQEFEPTAQSIRNWVGQAECDAGRGGNGLTTAEREELAQLRRENRELRLERDICTGKPYRGFESFPSPPLARFGAIQLAPIKRAWRRSNFPRPYI